MLTGTEDTKVSTSTATLIPDVNGHNGGPGRPFRDNELRIGLVSYRDPGYMALPHSCFIPGVRGLLLPTPVGICRSQAPI